MRCKKRIFTPTIKKRRVGTLDVYSFYRYSTIESLLLTKHKPEGYRIFRELSRMTMKPFVEHFTAEDPRRLYILGIDEQIKSGYSHVATMTREMKTAHSSPLHASLLSQNSVNYAGKTLQYRLNNPRNFIYSGYKNIDLILVDDIITTGLTLQEAQKRLKRDNVVVDFALVLADAKE